MKVANHPIMVGNGQWLLDLASLADYELGDKSEQGLMVSYAEFGGNAWDAVLFVPGEQLLELLRDAGVLSPEAELAPLSEQFDLCLASDHDPYLTMCLLGYDYRCRRCGLVRYFDADPPEWAKVNSYRNQENVGYPLNEHGEYMGNHPLGERSTDEL